MVKLLALFVLSSLSFVETARADAWPDATAFRDEGRLPVSCEYETSGQNGQGGDCLGGAAGSPEQGGG